MRPRDREVEVDEGRLTYLLALFLLILAIVFYSGLGVGRWLSSSQRSAIPAEFIVHGNAVVPWVLPAGFIGPPGPPYPPPVGDRPGLRREGTYCLVVRDFTNFSDADQLRRELFVRGYPAYLVGFKTNEQGSVRIGDYVTRGEVELVRERLEQRDGRAASVARW